MLSLRVIGENLPFGLLVVDFKGEIHYANPFSEKTFNLKKPYQKQILEILPGSNIIKVIKDGNFEITHYHLKHKFCVMCCSIKSGELGLILLFDEKVSQNFINNSPQLIGLKQELEAIMNLSGELVTITDGEGIVLRVNNTCEQILGVKEADFIGKSASVLEKNGVIDQSTTQYVIKNQHKVTMNQLTKSGRRLIVEGHPIFNSNGMLSKVINISKDITELANLEKKLEETKTALEYYQKEMSILQKDNLEMVVKSQAMEKVYELACRVADVDATIFLHGETGVGKEVLARTIHDLSYRKNAPFIKVNCGAIPESIMESELFGYAKGTFTGGNKEGKKGLALAADKGTLFLDEIGELPLNVQAKLLHLLQEKQFIPLGETKSVNIDVRFIAATNRNLEEMVKQGTFREDLYYRLVVIPITIPALSERKEDIPFLISHFLDKFCDKYKLFKTIDKEVVQFFIDYEWKGNVRELQNTIERLVVTSFTDHIELRDLPEKFLKTSTQKEPAIRGSLKLEMEKLERQMIIEALEDSSTMKEASKKLGIDASTMTRKVQKYKINLAKMQFQL